MQISSTGELGYPCIYFYVGNQDQAKIVLLILMSARVPCSVGTYMRLLQVVGSKFTYSMLVPIKIITKNQPIV